VLKLKECREVGIEAKIAIISLKSLSYTGTNILAYCLDCKRQRKKFYNIYHEVLILKFLLIIPSGLIHFNILPI
jgi:hypothetical protein